MDPFHQIPIRSIYLLFQLGLSTSFLGAASPYYQHDTSISFAEILPPPPATNSLMGAAERELMRNIEATRTPEMVEFAKQYDTISVFALLRPVLGAWCNEETLPITATVFAEVTSVADQEIEKAKALWNRTRPFSADPQLHPVLFKPSNTSYPSGHSALAEVYAQLLATALPEYIDKWNQQSQSVRWSRVVGGVHYPTDTVAGQKLGSTLSAEFLKSVRLGSDLSRVCSEIRKAYSERTLPSGASRPSHSSTKRAAIPMPFSCCEKSS